MRVVDVSPQPFHTLRYTNAGKRGRTVSASLPFHRVTVDALPEGIDALVLASDLQGVVSGTLPSPRSPRARRC